MATTKFYLDCRGKAKDGKGSVLITIYHNATTTTLSTGVRVSPQNWQKDKIVKLPGSESINASLQEQKLKIDKAIAMLSLEDGFDSMSASDIKKEIGHGRVKRINGHLLSTLVNEYISSGNLKENTKLLYKQTLQKAMQFGGENLRIESINLKWLRDFEQFLSKTQGVNGRAIYLRDLRSVCKYAQHTRIISECPFDNFHIKQEETQKRSVTVIDLRKFYRFETSADKSYYRDYFFLMFYLIGINTKDLLLAKKSQVINGRLEYVREKTSKKYSIKLEPETLELMKKYEGKGEYLLEAMDHCKLYRSFAHEINDALKLIGPIVKTEEPPEEDGLFAEPVAVEKVEPIIPGITTYFARHTWATLAHELDISSDVISMALGHSPTNRTTFIYIKPDQKKVDAANRKVIDYFLSKGEFSSSK